MLIFNTTYLVSDKMHGVWFKWLYERHIPAMLDSGFFTGPQVAKVLGGEPQDASSYSVQFHTTDMQSLNKWNGKYAEAFLNDFSAQFGEEVLLFSTVLEILE